MYKQPGRDEKGAVSMLTVIFVAIILTVITTSFVRLSVNEQRESIDDDLTTRAYYAAESGVQDAIIAIKNDSTATPVLNEDECLPHGGLGSGILSSDPALDVEYTCQLIDLAPDNLTADLGVNRSIMFELKAAPPTPASDPPDQIDNFTLSWHVQVIDAPTLRASTDIDLPTSVAWSAAEYPAMLRLQLIVVPTNDANVQRDEIGNIVTFLNPVDTATASGSIATPLQVDGINGNLVVASCDAGVGINEYVCNYSVTGLNDTDNNYFLRITSIYKPTSIKVEAYSGATLLELIDAQAAIDVTGRAGDVYRRVEERVNLEPNSLWPDYAIFSAEDICKNFVITETANDDPSDPLATLDFSDVNAGVNGSCL